MHLLYSYIMQGSQGQTGPPGPPGSAGSSVSLYQCLSVLHEKVCGTVYYNFHAGLL